jgi:adenylosuccinate lyase
MAVAEAVSRGEPNDLLDRLAGAPEFSGVPTDTLRAELDPARYVGRAPEQVMEFLGEFLGPLQVRAREQMMAAPGAELRV